VLHALFIFLQQAGRAEAAVSPINVSELYPPAALGGMMRNDTAHGTSGPHFQAGEQLFAGVAAVPETP